MTINHVSLDKYIGIKEEDGSYSIINPQSLDGYRSSLEEIQKYNIKIYDSTPTLPLYDKYGEKIQYPDLTYPEFDKDGKKIIYIDDKDDYSRLLPHLTRMPKTQEWINRVIERNYSRKYLPTWVKADEFYAYLTKKLFSLCIGHLQDKEKYVNIFDILFQLYGDVDLGASGGMDGKIESEYIRIPNCVVKEFISKGLIHEDLFDVTKLKDDFPEYTYIDPNEDNEEEEEEKNEVKEEKPDIRPIFKFQGSSSIMKPVKISKEMAEFCNFKQDTLHSKVEVTKSICEYIKLKNLQNPHDKRQIIPDEKLTKLLKLDPNFNKEPLNYPLLQKYLQPHFIKN